MSFLYCKTRQINVYTANPLCTTHGFLSEGIPGKNLVLFI